MNRKQILAAALIGLLIISTLSYTNLSFAQNTTEDTKNILKKQKDPKSSDNSDKNKEDNSTNSKQEQKTEDKEKDNKNNKEKPTEQSTHCEMTIKSIPEETPEEDESNSKLNKEDEYKFITYKRTSDDKVINSVCIKAGNKHYEITEDNEEFKINEDVCYEVLGIGTKEVTVTYLGREGICQGAGLSHIDISLAEKPNDPEDPGDEEEDPEDPDEDEPPVGGPGEDESEDPEDGDEQQEGEEEKNDENEEEDDEDEEERDEEKDKDEDEEEEPVGGQIQGTSTIKKQPIKVGEGEVLGTSTMAGTGNIEDSIGIIFTLGTMLTSIGIYSYGKENS